MRRVWLVTGASGGMGAAVAKRLLSDGDSVYGLDQNPPVSASGMVFFQTDLTDPDAVARAVSRLDAEGVRLDGIVHMAGIYALDSLVEMDERQWSRVLAVNLTAVWRVNRLCLQLLKPGGKILITTSELAPLHPLPFTGVYALSKAALDRYADALRMELQLLGHPVIVLRPGAVDTGLLGDSTSQLAQFCAQTAHYAVNAARFRQIVERVEARRIAPERIAEKTARILSKRYPKAVYSINRNPLLLLLDLLPPALQRWIIRGILKP